VIGVPDGKLLTSSEKSAVTAVMAPLASFVRLNVMFAVPLPLASASVIAGTSLDGSTAAVNFTWLALAEGVVGVFEPHPAASVVRAIARIVTRFIVSSP
jgi:hypothetical protein